MTEKNQDSKIEYSKPVIVAENVDNNLFVDGSFAESSCNEDYTFC